MHDYAKSKYRYFFLAFAIAFFVISLMFLFMMSTHRPKMPESLLREPETEIASVYAPTTNDALTVLFIGVESESATTATFLLARFDPANGKVPLVVFPPQTGVKNIDKIEPIFEVYRYGGAEFTKKALAETLGIPIDRYVKVRLESFVAVAAAIGSVEFDLPEAVTVTHGGASVTLNKGKQLLDGQKVADVIGYKYPEGELKRCEMTGALVAEIVNQRMDICLSTVVDGVFEKIINLINTDISYTDYYNRKPAAEFLARLGNKPSTPIPVAGQWSEGNKLYTLSDTFLAMLTQTLR